jgi:hypothetical protein
MSAAKTHAAQLLHAERTPLFLAKLRLRALGQSDVTDAVKARIDPDQLIWVVVGDAKVVEPQLAKVGMPVDVRRAGAK